MSLNILNALNELVHEGAQFKGAVFLTYSLNLQFFEQIIQPKLDALGCGHVVIITDEFGYREAMSTNLHQITSIGRRYVCTPLAAEPLGIQHGKMLMLVSKYRGWMLVGSGNLTFHGYGQNLELFEQFACDGDESPSASDLDVAHFIAAWRVVEHLRTRLGETAQTQLRHIRDLAPWLENPFPQPAGVTLWDTIAHPLIDRLREFEPVVELHLIAPFIDADVVEALVQHFEPRHLIVGLDAMHHGVYGKRLKSIADEVASDLEIRLISASDARSYRGLHAKAIIGVHQAGSWCVTGSSNITRPAVLDSWSGRGNLELVVFRSSDDPAAFNEIWSDPLIAVRTIAPEDVVHTVEEPILSVGRAAIGLTNLTERIGHLEGTVIVWSEVRIQSLMLELLGNQQTFPIPQNESGHFSVDLESPLQSSEAAVLHATLEEGLTITSAPVFIDQPIALDRFAVRSFHARVRGKLELVSDAESLFRELLEFLYQRVDKEAIHREAQERVEWSRRRQRSGAEGGQDAVLPARDFLTAEELVYQLSRHVDDLEPYVRDHYSLRDLLTLALLRLTTETRSPLTQDLGVEASDEITEGNVAEQRAIQQSGQERLARYLTQYCDRYAKRLTSHEFITGLGAAALFQNHFTLGRVLLEFYDKSDVFTAERLRTAARRIWLPMFCHGGVLDRCFELEARDNVMDAWADQRLSELLVLILTAAWSEPVPDWTARHQVTRIQQFMCVRHLIQLAEAKLSDSFWKEIQWSEVEWAELTGYYDVKDLQVGEATARGYVDAPARIERLANYSTPVEERYAEFFYWQQLRNTGLEASQEARELAHRLQHKDPRAFLLVRQTKHVRAILGAASECPSTHLELPDNDLRRLRNGEILASQHDSRMLLYWMPDLDSECH